MTIIYFIFILGTTVFVHELGHFLFAKKYGVYVYEFAIGVEILGGGEFFVKADLYALLGILANACDECEGVEIEVIGLVDTGKECFFFQGEGVGGTAQVGVDGFQSLNSEKSSTEHIIERVISATKITKN